jgi:hypothetical protein
MRLHFRIACLPTALACVVVGQSMFIRWHSLYLAAKAEREVLYDHCQS